MAWRHELQERFEVFAPELMTVSYAGEWLEIRHCRLAIRKGYAWDGCSPSFRLPGGPLLPGGAWFGPWDGPLRPDGRPVCWRASLVHDALCQFRHEIQGLTKEPTVTLFARMLREDGAPAWMSKPYPAAVNRFGPQDWLGDAGLPDVKKAIPPESAGRYLSGT